MSTLIWVREILSAMDPSDAHPTMAGGRLKVTFSVVDSEGLEHTVVLDAEKTTTVSTVTDRLAATLDDLKRSGDSQPRLFSATAAHAVIGLQLGETLLPGDLTLAESPLRDGCRVGLNRPMAAEPDETAQVELRVVSGPGAGNIYPLTPREVLVGTDPSCAVRLPSGATPGQAARVQVNSDGAVTVAPIPPAHVLLDGEPLVQSRSWHPGEQLTAGDMLVELRVPAPDVVDLVPSKDVTGLDYNRGPRILVHEALPKTRYKLPPAPTRSQPHSAVPLIAMMAQLAVGLAAGLAFGATWFILLALAPVILAGTGLSSRLSANRSYGRRSAEYHIRRDEVMAAAQQALIVERSARRDAHPDPAEVLLTAIGPKHRLWERQPSDYDYLVMRVGTADLPSELTVEAADSDDELMPLTARDVPVTIQLQEHGVIGIAGMTGTTNAMARWLVAQAAVLHRPADLTMCVLTEGNAAPRWEWVRWLPHLLPRQGQQAVALLGTDEETTATRVAELVSLVAARLETLPTIERANRATILPNMMVVIDGARRLSKLPGFAQILRDGPTVGIYFVCLDSSVELLPKECQAVVSEQKGGSWLVQDRTKIVEVNHLDLLDVSLSERIARALAPIRDAAEGRDAELPDSVRLLDLLGIEPPTPEAITARWQTSPRSTEALVGISLDGPFALDLTRDGPHGLIAGTTGAGKTELLLTIIASLAVANSPEEMVFVLFDYKGGSSFRVYDSLPHAVSIITDLDRHGAARVFVSLSAELRRREQIFHAASAVDLESYALARDRRRDLQPVPRLVLIIDEVAGIEMMLPDFVSGLADIVRHGRSFGVHLLLATQRALSVPTRIQSNMDLRIAMRMIEADDSRYVINAPDAARIPRSTRGRGYARLAPDVLVSFQAARVGGYHPDSRTTRPAVWIQPLEWSDLGRPFPTPSRSAPLEDETTDLSRLVDAINGATKTLGIAPGNPPLLPPLPFTLPISSLAARVGDPSITPIVFGLEDRPEEQSQVPATLRLATVTALLVGGARGSGRSQLLRTLAGAVARQYSCADVHLYGIDCGGGALSALAELPHCGAVVTDKEPELVARLLGRLTAAIRRRQELMAEGGFADVTDQRRAVPPPQQLPHLILLLDNWDRFEANVGEVDHGKLAEDLLTIVRDGGSAGVHVVIAGDFGLLSKRFAASAEKLVLRPNKDDLSRVGIYRHDISDNMPPGRAIRANSGIELQIALLDGNPTPNSQASALAKLAVSVRARDSDVTPSRRPFRLDELPFVDDRFHVGDAEGRPIGREDVIAWLRDRHATGASAALVGPRRAGKTWILRELSRRLISDGSTSVKQVVVPQPSTAVDTPDALAEILDRDARGAPSPSEAVLDAAKAHAGTPDRLVYLLDEVGRLVDYHPAAISWLRDLGQSGAWILYTGSEKDWHLVRNWALTAPGSSFGNDVNARLLGPLDNRAAIAFLVGTAANLGVSLEPKTSAAIIDRVGTWPFYLQVVGDAVVRTVQGGDTRPLVDTEALSELIKLRLLDEWTQHFQARWAEIAAAGRAALLSHRGDAPQLLSPAQRNDLREVGLLCAGDIWLGDLPFFDWVKRNRTSLQDRES